MIKYFNTEPRISQRDYLAPRNLRNTPLWKTAPANNRAPLSGEASA